MKIWGKISNVGVSEDMSDAEIRAGQLINQANFFCALFSFCFVPCLLFLGLTYYIPFQLATGLLTLFSFYLSYLKKFNASTLFLIFVLTLNLIYFSLCYHNTGIEFFLIPLAAMPFATSKKSNITYIIVAWCILAFFLTKYLAYTLPPRGEIKEPYLTLTFILIISGVFGGMLSTLYSLKKANDKFEENILSRKKEVEEQKNLVEEKQKEILDSIHYAKRIQTALLPNNKYIDKNLNRLKK